MSLPFQRSFRIAVKGHVMAIARGAYIAVILLATLADLHFDPSTAEMGFRLRRAFDLTLDMHDAVDAVRNIALFAGLGAVWVVTSPSGKVWRSTWHVTVIGFFLSVAVETSQLFSPVRESSIVDVTTNTVGAFLGAGSIIVLVLLVHAARHQKSFVGIPAFLFAGSYGAAVLMEAFAPLFRQDLLPNLGGGVLARLGRAWAAMEPRSVFAIPILDMALFFPAGAFGVAALAEAGIPYARAWPMVAVVGTIACAVIEVVHGVVGQPIQLGAILSHGGAITLGAWATARWLPVLSARLRGRQRSRTLFILYSVVILIWSWRPFIPELNMESIRQQLAPEHWIPLQAMAVRVDLFSVADIVTQFLLYLPLGALLAVWPLRTQGRWRHLLPALYLSIVCELGKIVIAERFLDVTHIFIQVAGAAIGWIVVRRSGFRLYGEIWASP
jgi:glycopeptide antibiotics resistance protein